MRRPIQIKATDKKWGRTRVQVTLKFTEAERDALRQLAKERSTEQGVTISQGAILISHLHSTSQRFRALVREYGDDK